MAALRKTVFVLLLVLFVAFAAVFAHTNPDPISVDVGFMRFERVPAAVAFSIAFALGWVFGLVSAGATMLRGAGERMRLRRRLKLAESEVSSLRSLPLHDAD